MRKTPSEASGEKASPAPVLSGKEGELNAHAKAKQI